MATLRDQLSRLDRVQRSLTFKIIASALIIAVAAAIVITYAVNRAADDRALFDSASAAISGPAGGAERTPPPPDETPELRTMREELEAAEEVRRRALQQVLSLRAGTTEVAVGSGLVGVVLLGVVWIGKGLTGVAIGALIALVALPLRALGDARAPVIGITWHSLGSFIGAVSALAFAFTVLMELARLALSGRWAVTAIARNVVLEAVRQKVSLVFIVMLIVAMAALPGLLNEETPLRYRVQSFLQYGAGGSYWIIALLVVTLSVATVAFEQRDKVIWQTMTKPVAAWQYLLGKWLGVMAVAAALLAVSASGIFLFTEYLKEQRAVGEVAPYRTSDGREIAEDRDILFTQVLSASVTRRVYIPGMDPSDVLKEVERRVQIAAQNNPLEFRDTPEIRAQLQARFLTEQRDAFLAIEPGGDQAFEFRNLNDAREQARVLTLRYKVNIGTNDPRDQQWITFTFPNFQPQSVNAPAAQQMTMRLNPAAISDDGVLRVLISSGRFIPPDTLATQPGAQMISFPPDGLEVSYAVGSYRMNFIRVILIFWMKLGFIAMVGIAASTFLSFPVASLVSFGVFLMAEGAGFLASSLDSFSTEDAKGNPLYVNRVIEMIATPIARGFSVYGNLRPTSSLVEGRLLAWSQVFTAFLYMGFLCALLYLIAVLIFRKRELAIYSGQ